MKIDLNNQIIIIDEAHNIEESAQDAGSLSISEKDLANTTNDLHYLMCDNVKLEDHGPLHYLCQKLVDMIRLIVVAYSL